MAPDADQHVALAALRLCRMRVPDVDAALEAVARFFELGRA